MALQLTPNKSEVLKRDNGDAQTGRRYHVFLTHLAGGHRMTVREAVAVPVALTLMRVSSEGVVEGEGVCVMLLLGVPVRLALPLRVTLGEGV